MKRILIALLVITTLSATAQESVLLRLNYAKGDSYLISVDSKQSTGMQGGMNMKMTMGMIVADVVEESIKTESQITSIVIDMMQGGMTMSYDSNSDEELDQMGQMLKSQFAPMMEAITYATIDHQGNLIDTKQAFHIQYPGEMLNLHIDKQYEMNPDASQVARFFIFLEDWKPGHFMHMGTTFVKWRRGDLMWFDWPNMPHASANAGWEPRCLIQITGTMTKWTEDIMLGRVPRITV